MVKSKIFVGAKQSLGANLSTMVKARQLRKRMTSAENVLWSRIRKRKVNGMYFRRQHPYGIYILDFFCFDANLAIEVDGLVHLNRKDYDLERTKYLQSTGLKVIRFSNSDIENKIDWVVEEIMKVTEPFILVKSRKVGSQTKKLRSLPEKLEV